MLMTHRDFLGEEGSWVKKSLMVLYYRDLMFQMILDLNMVILTVL